MLDEVDVVMTVLFSVTEVPMGTLESDVRMVCEEDILEWLWMDWFSSAERNRNVGLTQHG